VKGKHANAAERRRHIEALENRAETAERTAGKLEAELTELREKTTQQITALRREVTALIAQRDEASAPALDEAMNRVADLTSELKANEEDATRFKKDYRRLHRIALGLLREKGYTGAEADAALIWATPEAAQQLDLYKADAVSKRVFQKHGAIANERIAKARGFHEALTTRVEDLADQLEAMLDEPHEEAE
jgi:vacuolar-type H+-ATPase subunit I/STV1